MSKPAIVLIVKGLKCDKPGCGFKDESAPVDESQLNRPCPHCGSSLLTEIDLANVRLLQYVTHSINSEESADDDSPYISQRVLMDGTGKMEIVEDL